MRFFRPGLMAIEQKAFLFDFPSVPKRPQFEDHDGVAVVTIRGPLVHHDEGCFDNYDDIKARVRAAVGTKPKAILLSIDSPGGLVSGCFDASTEIRAICETAEVPLYAYVDGQTCSGGVALAMAADTIFIPPAGVMGSIGVIEGIIDERQMDARNGISFAFVASGARKLDGNPHVGITDEAIAETQARVDTTAERFFELVAEARGLDVNQVRALQAGLFVGQQAIDAGLADELATEDEAIVQIAQWATTAAEPSATEGTEPMKTLAEIKTALKAVAEGDGDEKDKDEANKMLSALASEDGDEDDAPAVAAAEGGDEPPPADEDEDEEDEEEVAPAASASASSAPAGDTLAMAERLHKLEIDAAASAERRKKAKALRVERAEKTRLLASRPDFTQQMRSFLESQPLATVQHAVKTFAKGANVVVSNPVAATQNAARPTLGDGQADLRQLLMPNRTDEEILDDRMGLGRQDLSKAIRQDGAWVKYSALTPDEARHLQQLKAAK